MSTSQHQLVDNMELNNLVHPQQRDIYVGPRISHTVKARWQGNLHELQIGKLVATLARENEFDHLFWVAKILEIIKNEQSNQLKINCGSLVSHIFP